MNTSTFEVLREIIARDYGLAPESLRPETPLQELQIDSLALIELIFNLEDRFGVKAESTPEDFPTLDDVAIFIDRLIATRDAASAGGAASDAEPST